MTGTVSKGITSPYVTMFRCSHLISCDSSFVGQEQCGETHWGPRKVHDVVSTLLYLLPPSFQFLGCYTIISQEPHSCSGSTSVRLPCKSVVNAGQMGKVFWLQLIKPKDRDQMWKTSVQKEKIIK